MRKIARHLHLARRTISLYLATPARRPAPQQRASKLDPFKSTIAELLEQDANASAMVIAQRLRPLGFTGGLSILKDYLHAVRVQTAAKRAYVRMEPGPGERFEIDWGHFGALLYQGHARKLIASPASGQRTPPVSMPAPWIASHPTKNTTDDDGRTTFDDVPRLYIDPVERIDCGAAFLSAPCRRCALNDLPEKWKQCTSAQMPCRSLLPSVSRPFVGRSGIEAFLLPLRSILCLLHRDLVDM
jgi:hypothetical protein